MNEEDLQLDGEVSRALVVAGLSFSLQRGQTPDGRVVRFFKLLFEDEGLPPFEITAYVAPPFFVAGCGLRLLSDVSLDRLNEALTRQVPLVRLVKDTLPGSETRTFLWVEATSVLPPGPWSADSNVLASVPVHIVSNSMRILLSTFHSDLDVAPASIAPFMNIVLAGPPAVKAG
jgi:hypothetical protein